MNHLAVDTSTNICSVSLYCNSKYFVYENQFHKYSNILKNSFQHGGISLDEVLVPLIHLKNKK